MPTNSKLPPEFLPPGGCPEHASTAFRISESGVESVSCWTTFSPVMLSGVAVQRRRLLDIETGSRLQAAENTTEFVNVSIHVSEVHAAPESSWRAALMRRTAERLR